MADLGLSANNLFILKGKTYYQLIWVILPFLIVAEIT